MSKRAGDARLERLFELAQPVRGVVVDVGSDHGRIAEGLLARAEPGAQVISTERRSHRLSRDTRVPCVVADGLAPFRQVDLAVIAGMGPHAILGILSRGPRPARAVVHSPDRTDTLRQGLKDQGWRIDAEALAPEGRRFAEVLRIVPGDEPASGHLLWFGPRLWAGDDPLLADHVASVTAHWRRVATSAPEGSPGHTRATGWVEFLAQFQGRS